MIKTLSPYYVTVPLTNPDTSVVCDSFVFKIYIWNGNKSSAPSTPEYEQTIINAAASNGNHKLDIARLANDFIDFSCVQAGDTSLEDGNNQVWVKVEVYYNDQPYLAQNQSTQLATKGYGYFLDGENSQVPTNKILLSGDEFKVNRNGFFVLPILMTETTPPTPELEIDSIVLDSGDSYIITFTTNIGYVEIYFRYSLTGMDDWTLGDETITSSPFTITIPSVSGTYDVQIFTYDPLTDTNVYSAYYVLIIP